MNSTYAPIAVFVYNRPGHTEKLLDSLLGNELVSESEITVYADGPASDRDQVLVDEVRCLVKDRLPQAELRCRDSNAGLASSIINGVTEQCDRHGKVIVLEDDLILSPLFLQYMNQALERYEQSSRVMHISAYLPPIDITMPPAFFYREPNPWGWGTWKRAWDCFEADSRKQALELYDKGQIADFNQGHAEPYWEMLCKQWLGEVDSWAIRWHATLFRHNGLALYPGESLVVNSGFDGSGRHCTADNRYDTTMSKTLPELANVIDENTDYLKAVRRLKLNGPLHRFSRQLKHRLNRRSYLQALTG